MRNLIKKIDRSFSRITGNSSGLSKTVSGTVSTIAKSIRSNVNTDFEKGESLRRKGYANTSTRIPVDVVSELSELLQEKINRKECTYLIEHNNKVYSEQVLSYNVDGGGAFDFGRLKHIEGIITSEIKQTLHTYYRSHFRPEFIKIYRNHHVPKKVIEEKPSVFSDDWHCDGRETDFVKLFVALNEITEDDGPFHVVSEEKTKELFRRGFDRDESEWQEKVRREVSPTRMTGPPGSAMIANTNTALHRAGHPEKGRVRDVALIQFVPSSRPLPNEWSEKIEYNRTHRPIF